MKQILVTLTTMLALSVPASKAQAQKDSLAGIRLFMRVCNSYKQLPIQLQVDIRHSANLVNHPDDTSRVSAQFFLQQQGSYIEMEGLEQVVNDSLMLLVSRPTKRMILYTHRQSVANQLKQYLGLGLQDSSLVKIAEKYRSVSGSSRGDTSSLELVSRTNLYSTSLAAEQITVKYDPATERPYQVTDTRRNLIAVEQARYKSYASNAEWAGKTLSVGDTSFFLIKEVASVFSYKKLTHDDQINLPVRISDRIVADENGRFRPVKRYGDYLLTQQF